MRFSITERSGSRLFSWGMTPRRALIAEGSLFTSMPKTVTVPLVGGMKQEMMRITVVLPAPLGPRKPKHSPSAMATSMPLTARSPL